MLLPVPVHQPGHSNGVYFQVFGQGVVSALCVTSHNLDLSVFLQDTTSTCTGGRTGRTAGKGDSQGTISAYFDALRPPYLNPPYIIPGVSGIMYFYFSAVALGRFFSIPCVVEKLHFESTVGDFSKWTLDVKENAHVGDVLLPSA